MKGEIALALFNYIIPNFGEKDESNLDLQALKILQTEVICKALLLISHP